MPDTRGQVLPVYVLADESTSMAEHIGELNAGLASLHSALLAEPMAAAKVRFCVLGFSDDVVVRLHLADLRRVHELPQLVSRGATSYEAAFRALLRDLPQDVRSLKQDGYQVHRPAVFFLSDGQPTDGESWRMPHRQLTDRAVTPAGPNIIACGIGAADPATMIAVATQPDFAFVPRTGLEVGAAVARFCRALTQSVVSSATTVVGGQAELRVDVPEGFRMAIDVV